MYIKPGCGRRGHENFGYFRLHARLINNSCSLSQFAIVNSMIEKSLTHILIEIIGWVGVSEIVIAFALVSFGLIDAGFTFQFLNLNGAIAIIVHSLYKKDYQPAVINVVIATIAISAIIRLL